MKADLIAQLEAATEGSRELDAEVALRVFSFLREYRPWPSRPGHWNGPDGHVYAVDYTTSIDAALTLLPEGCVLLNLSRRTQPEMGGRMWSVSLGGMRNIHSGGQRTPALALCVAILKARENEG